MTKEYDHITAFHYSAFRPALHKYILDECLKGHEENCLGLDVGCGTGQSSIALTNYCEKVIGIEPSKEMLDKSLQHPRVEYAHYNCKKIDFESNYFDHITFAGSLYYAKSQKLLDEVIRVSKHTARIIVYDFEIRLDTIMEKLNVDCRSKQKSNYNHQENFSGLNQKNISIKQKLVKSLSLEITNANLAHLLLSSKDNYNLLIHKFGYDNLHDKISKKLNSIFKSELSNI
ncbi:MAG: class I SAM-dependent methyltransferase, partial [Maribacter sp.]|nr:class I SAM-dependent methyltransferase [Maribacter sp.]